MTPSDEAYVVDDGIPAIATAMWMGTAALMILGIQPILLATLVAEHRITDAMLGQLATVEVLSIALSSAVGAPFFRAPRMRLKAAVLCGLLAAVNIGCCFGSGQLTLFLLRGAAGVLEGLLLGCTIVLLTRSRAPDRINGVFLAAQTIPQALAALALPIYLTPRWGSDAGFVVLAAMAALGVCLVPLLPRSGLPPVLAQASPTEARRGVSRWVWTPEIAFVLLALMLQTSGIGAAMEYLAELAAHHGFSNEAAGLATSGNLITQVVGAFLVVGVAYRIPSALALLIGVAAQFTMAMAFPALPNATAYIVVACLFGAFLLALGPFQVAWLVRIEPTRRIALLITPVTLIGWSIGPFVASFFVTSGHSDAAFWTAAGLFACAGLSYVAALLSRGRALPAPVEARL
jgi:predicted MFS family arabinose efflux permease